jgi:hypothetical protein
MTCWWILPFAGINLAQFPLWENLASYYAYFIPVIVTGIFSIICGQVEAPTGWWSRAGFWKKYLVIIGLYTLNIILIIALTITLHDKGVLSFFGGDPEGSFGMIYPWTVILYLLAGSILGVWKSFRA